MIKAIGKFWLFETLRRVADTVSLFEVRPLIPKYVVYSYLQHLYNTPLLSACFLAWQNLWFLERLGLDCAFEAVMDTRE